MTEVTYPGNALVLAEIRQMFRALDPVTGDERTLGCKTQGGLTREEMVDYGEDWLAVYAADVAATELVQIDQHLKVSSADIPRIYEDDTGGNVRWRPLADAMREAKTELRRWARLRFWGGSR